MITFEKELDVQELELHKKLCLMGENDEVYYVIVKIEYYISKYRPATWFDPAEGGEIEDWDVKVTDGMFSEKQRKIITDGLCENAIKDAIWSHYDKNNLEGHGWY